MFSQIRRKIEDERYSRQMHWRFMVWGKDLAGTGLYTAKRLYGASAFNWFIQISLEKLGTVPRIFVETGTYRGDNVKLLLRTGNWRFIHTIELSEAWYQRAAKRFERYPNVVCHHGDSANVLETLLPTINEPIIIYLDAHYSGGSTAFGNDEVPLLRELQIIARRQCQDIVIIDDLRLFGKTGISGDGSKLWPEMTYDWKEINEHTIRKALGKNIGGWEERDDRLILWNFGSKIDQFHEKT